MTIDTKLTDTSSISALKPLFRGEDPALARSLTPQYLASLAQTSWTEDPTREHLVPELGIPSLPGGYRDYMRQELDGRPMLWEIGIFIGELYADIVHTLRTAYAQDLEAQAHLQAIPQRYAA